jgi:lysophospholipase L1-like esterase
MRSILFWCLLPFVMPQAYFFRKNTPRFNAPTGEKNGSAGKGDRNRFIAIGDSIIAGVGASTLEKALVGQTASALAISVNSQIDWTVIGKIGITSKGILEKLIPELPKHEAEFIFLSAGVNDITSLARTRDFRKSMHRLIDALEQHSPSAVIAVAGIPPLRGFPLLPQPLRALLGLRGISFDDVVKDVAQQYQRVVYVPLSFDPSPEKFSSDGFHPSEASYREYADIVAAQLVAHQKVMRLWQSKNTRSS